MLVNQPDESLGFLLDAVLPVSKITLEALMHMVALIAPLPSDEKIHSVHSVPHEGLRGPVLSEQLFSIYINLSTVTFFKSI